MQHHNVAASKEKHTLETLHRAQEQRYLENRYLTRSRHSLEETRHYSEGRKGHSMGEMRGERRLCWSYNTR